MRVKKHFSNSTMKSEMKIEGENTRNPDDTKKVLYLHDITVSAQMCHQQHRYTPCNV